MIVFATNFRLIISVFCGALMERYTCGSQKPMPQGLRVRISRALPYKGNGYIFRCVHQSL